MSTNIEKTIDKNYYPFMEKKALNKNGYFLNIIKYISPKPKLIISHKKHRLNPCKVSSKTRMTTITTII